MKIHIQRRLNQKKLEKQADNEHEAALHFSLIDFAQMIEAYGANKVLSSMDETTFWHLYKWFKETFEYDFKRG